MRVLIAGVGNVLHGDDGFGVEVARRLVDSRALPTSVRVMETGIGGIHLVQELMQGYEALILVDAVRRGGSPGELHLLEPVLPDLSTLDVHQRRDHFADSHYATPMRALSLIDAVGVLPETILIIGCEVGPIEDLRIGLSDPVSDAVDRAADLALRWLEQRLLVTDSRPAD